ncbi:McrC family protein [Pedobacter sp.]|uniref:McrC family protein n=1 Tax=Pedobacter sp. TaxID=1411316 RepID=UPI003C54500F
MKISIPVNHNFYEEKPIYPAGLAQAFGLRPRSAKEAEKLFSSFFELKLDQERFGALKLFSFNRKRPFKPDRERLVLRLYAKDEPERRYFMQTGLYAGTLFHKGCKINISSRYGDAFLKRMLNFVCEVYIDNESTAAKKEDTENQFLYIIAHLFIQGLEKAAVLGLPQEYQTRREHSHKVRGKIDFNAYLKQDIPFSGKLTSVFRERSYIPEIIDVLHLALRKLESLFGREIHSRLVGITQVLKQNYSGQYASLATLQKAKNHQAINNPMYSGFKRVLEYAEIILLNHDLSPENSDPNTPTHGHLFDIAELFELYLEKLLARKFTEWSVSAQESMDYYQDQFYGRQMFPDLVMRHRETGRVAVFDAKFKKMDMTLGDVDRADLHQIHSYAGYYGSEMVASGLLYPLSKEIPLDRAHSTSLYGGGRNQVSFIIDGINVHSEMTMAEIISHEERFINRISKKLSAEQ